MILFTTAQLYEMASNATTPPTESPLGDNDAFFVLDFVARYAVERCGAPATVTVGIMSSFCIIPVWIWFATVTLSLTRPEIYAYVAKNSLGLLTLLQVLTLVLFYQEPPVVGCGPMRSFPSPQTSISAYGTTLFMFFDGSLRRQSRWWRVSVLGQFLLVYFSVVTLGFASPPAATAGTVLGVTAACTLHVALVILADQETEILNKMMSKIESFFGIVTVNTVLHHVDGPSEDHQALQLDGRTKRHQASSTRYTTEKLLNSVQTAKSTLVMGYPKH